MHKSHETEISAGLDCSRLPNAGPTYSFNADGGRVLTPAGRAHTYTMNEKQKTLGKILSAGILPNLIKDKLDVEQTVAAAVGAGVRAIEVSCRRPDTVELLIRLRRRFPEVAFGVSSLIEEGPYFQFLQRRGPAFPTIAQAVDAGAAFLVSLISFSPETFRRFSHLPIVPGVSSPDQAKQQLDFGASLVKFSNLGAPAFKAINGGPIHFGLPLLVTGGVRPEHVADLTAARVLVCVSGMDLILKGRYEALQEKLDPVEVRERVGEYVAAFAAARQLHRPEVDFASADPRLIQAQSGQFMNVE